MVFPLFQRTHTAIEFWLGYAAILVTIGALAPLFVRLFGFTDAAPYDPQKFLLVLTFYVKASTVVSVWPTIAIYAKRLHDLGLSAWWLLVWGLATLVAETIMAAGFMIPLLGFAILGFVPGTVGTKSVSVTTRMATAVCERPSK